VASQRLGFELSESTQSQLVSINGRPQFTPKQQEVFEQMLLGLPNRIIAKRLGMAEGTVKTHLHKIYQLLQVTNRAKAILKAQQLHLIA
jgi:DNA-binding NarL/FixJ family response regulator